MDALDCWSIAYEFIVNGEIEKAVSFCETEACSNSILCQRYLGWIYYEKGDMERALNWFNKAAIQKDGEAIFGIGCVHIVNKNFQSALYCFESATDNGYFRGHQWAASIYHRGNGVPINTDKAIEHYRKGAEHGYIMAERSLISLESKKGGFITKFVSIFKFAALLIKTMKISLRDINDPRLMDVPNHFKKISPTIVK
jgi:TPR repeat protein